MVKTFTDWLVQRFDKAINVRMLSVCFVKNELLTLVELKQMKNIDSQRDRRYIDELKKRRDIKEQSANRKNFDYY